MVRLYVNTTVNFRMKPLNSVAIINVLCPNLTGSYWTATYPGATALMPKINESRENPSLEQ